jgi:hypothetical protein
MGAHWSSNAARSGPNFAAEMEGVCIVDALDESLSPRQQRCAIPALRRAFPKVSFVVSVYAEPSIRPFGLDDIVMFDWRFDSEAATVGVLDVVDAADVEQRSTEWSW